ncbi:MAG: trehalase family glycosidase [Verrucomicrobia bacterium]|nr:trehalase family glycosidase [Verrucomicrobiota bacterium]
MKYSPTGVSFHTSDANLQRLYDAAEASLLGNIVQFTPTLKALVEGGGYPNVWIETQPMGGEMYAKRNLEVALNNQIFFLLGQRADGRLPGMVVRGSTAREHGHDKQPPEGMVWIPEHDLLASFEMFQGYCFPDPAWRMYFWTGKDRAYLSKLHDALEKHDAYLWRTRDSDGDGLLETWCVWDTGEDACSRLVMRNAPTRWPFDFPPGSEQAPDPLDPSDFKRYWIDLDIEKLPPPTREEVLVPFASMDVMAYSFEGRATLAKIAHELGNGREAYWQEQAEEVRQRLIQGLWDPERSACFDRDRTGKRLEELIHNNLRCMWYGVFTQEMADAFIRRHLLNPAEFWTPVPLPSIAVNEPLYGSIPGNNWSGQPMGLTYQRAIRALENYGHHAEVSLLGQKLLPVLILNGCTFQQQLETFAGTSSGLVPDGYGPMILAALEYISRLHGIHLDVANDRVWWSALRGSGGDFTYTQRWGERTFTLDRAGGRVRARLNGRELFICTDGARVVTDLEGAIQEVVGIQPEIENPDTALTAGDRTWFFSLKPNQVVSITNDQPKILRAAPFNYPYAGETI